jgi:hypothetical protein
MEAWVRNEEEGISPPPSIAIFLEEKNFWMTSMKMIPEINPDGFYGDLLSSDPFMLNEQRTETSPA